MLPPSGGKSAISTSYYYRNRMQLKNGNNQGVWLCSCQFAQSRVNISRVLPNTAGWALIIDNPTAKSCMFWRTESICHYRSDRKMISPPLLIPWCLSCRRRAGGRRYPTPARNTAGCRGTEPAPPRRQTPARALLRSPAFPRIAAPMGRNPPLTGRRNPRRYPLTSRRS